MKQNGKKLILSLLAVIIMVITAFTVIPMEATAASGDSYTNNAIMSSRIDRALTVYGPGSYFSKNGKQCGSCHNQDICVSNNSPCNCLRYLKIDNKTVDLRAVQCMGYAHYFQYMLFGDFGFTDASKAKFTKISGSSSSLTADTTKAYFLEYKDVLHPGTHIRVRGDAHSLILLKIDYEQGTISYIDANYDLHCRVNNVVTYTWAQFASKHKSVTHMWIYTNYNKEFPECACKSFESSGICKECGKVFDWSSTKESASGIYAIIDETCPSTTPYEVDRDTSITLKLGDQVELLGKYTNAYGNTWYEVSYDHGTKKGFVYNTKIQLVADKFYTTNNVVTANSQAKIWSVPCSNETIDDSYVVAYTQKGEILEPIRTVYNTQNHYWYEVKTAAGDQGWIYCENTTFKFVKTESSGVIVGDDFPLTILKQGRHVQYEIKTSNSTIKNVTGAIYNGTATSGTAVCEETAKNVNSKYYNIYNSSIDYALPFGSLTVGKQYTLVISADLECKYFNGSSEQTYTYTVSKAWTFKVVSENNTGDDTGNNDATEFEQKNILQIGATSSNDYISGKWYSTSFDGTNIQDSGCGIVSLVSAVYNLGGTISKDQIGDVINEVYYWAYYTGRWSGSSGTYESMFPASDDQYGDKYHFVVSAGQGKDLTNLINHIKSGKGTAVVHVYSHYMVIVDYKEVDDVQYLKVFDPAPGKINSSSYWSRNRRSITTAAGDWIKVSDLLHDGGGAVDGDSWENVEISNYWLVSPKSNELEVACTGFTPEENASLPTGLGYPVWGTVTSNYPLEKVVAMLDGKEYATWTASNKTTTSFDINPTDINNNLKFSSLSAGRHTVTLIATDIYGRTQTFLVRNFNMVSSSCSHTYSSAYAYDENGHWMICSKCGSTTSAENHSYTSSCDSSCNTCGYTRAASHTYDNACDSTCNICGETRKISHDYEYVYEDNLEHVEKCKVCGEESLRRHLSDYVIYYNGTHHFLYCVDCKTNYEFLDHNYDNACDATCRNCEYVRTITHTYDGDCDAECNVCGETRTAGAHMYDDACDTTCNVCGETRVVLHSLTSVEYNEEGHWFICGICGFVTDSGEHLFGEIVTKEPTCTEAGEKHTICATCGYDIAEEIPSTDHIYGDFVVTKEASCTEPGTEEMVCENCGDVVTAEIAPTGHSYGKFTVVEKATCQENGEKTKTCSICGDVETVTIPATGHDFGDWYTVGSDADGNETERRDCYNCGHYEIEVIEIEPEPDPGPMTIWEIIAKFFASIFSWLAELFS